jgi:hypothetical protein
MNDGGPPSIDHVYGAEDIHGSVASRFTKRIRMRKIFVLLFLCSLNVTSDRASGQKADFTGVPGVVVAHSPKASGLYLGSPSICILSDGSYVASHDLFGPSSQEGEAPWTHVFHSSDKGKTWKQIAKVKNQFWSNLFVHKDKLYLLGTSAHPGSVSLRQSSDRGHTWTDAVDKKHGLLADDATYHCAPVPVIVHQGRIWRAMEDTLGPVKGWGKEFRALMMSAAADDDLMDAENWTFSNRLPFDSNYLDGNFGGWLEGNAVVTPRGEIVDLLRVDYRQGDTEKAAMIRISADGKTATFDRESGFVNFPGGCKKFTVRYDPKSKLYWTLSNYIPEEFRGGNVERTRNTQALSCSRDLKRWKVCSIILQHQDVAHHGFQYLDWQFEGDDMIVLSRTAYEDGLGGADNQHNANLITFHRIKNFRKQAKKATAIY